MSTLSTRMLAALAFERGEEFDPATTLPSAPLAEDLALLAGARPLVYEPSPRERRRRRERARRDARAAERSGAASGELPAIGRPRASRHAAIPAADGLVSTTAENRRALDGSEAPLGGPARPRRRSSDS